MVRITAAFLLTLTAATLSWAQQEPPNGWGLHFRECLPQHTEPQGLRGLESLEPEPDAVSGVFEQYELFDPNSDMIWKKKFTVWRIACPNNPAFPATLMRIEHLEDGPAADNYPDYTTLHYSDLSIRQRGVRAGPGAMMTCSEFPHCVRTHIPPADYPVTVLIPYTLDSAIYLADEFVLEVLKRYNEYDELMVPAFVGQPPATGTPVTLHGSLSGSWYDPTRSGEGFVFEFGENVHGKVLTAYWFTYLNGHQYWLIGIQQYQPGNTEITLELLEFTASGFGSNFDPESVQNRHFGEITLRFDSCTTGEAHWVSNIGHGSGSFQIQRITSGVDGLKCVQ